MTVSAPRVRTGVSYWLSGYRSMLRFEVLNLRLWLATALVIQLLMGAGMVYMYGFYFGDVPADARTFIVTGVPALALVPVGFVLVPNLIMQHKLRDTYDFVWSLPVPRLASAAATFTVTTALALPGTAAALGVAVARYDISLAPSWSILVAVPLVALMASSVGFALGHSIPDPRVTNLITNLIIFLVLLFSPIVVPIELFPEWWAAVHRTLPFWHMAVVVRAGLTNGIVSSSIAGSYLALGAWTVASWSLTAWVVARRH